MKATFKQFNTLINLPDDELTEEKLAEIFGWSDREKQEKAKQKIVDLQAKKDALKKQQSANTAAQMAKKQQIGQAGSAMATGQAKTNGPKAYDAKPMNQMRGAQSRAAERDWVSNLTNEGARPLPKLTDKAKDCHQTQVSGLIKKHTGKSTYFDDVDLVDLKSNKDILPNALHPKKAHTIADLIDHVKKFKNE